jgi:hypothetical protein
VTETVHERVLRGRCRSCSTPSSLMLFAAGSEGNAHVELPDGPVCRAEVHWYEAGTSRTGQPAGNPKHPNENLREESSPKRSPP